MNFEIDCHVAPAYAKATAGEALLAMTGKKICG